MQAIEREVLTTHWITILLLLSFFAIAVLKMHKPFRFKAYSLSFFYKGFLEIEADEKESPFSFFHIIYLTFSFIVLSLTVYFLLNMKSESLPDDFTNYLLIASVLLAYLGIKLVLEYVLMILFELKDMLFFFYISKRGYLYSLTIALGFLLLTYVYGYTNSNFLLYGSLILVGFRFFLIVFNNKNLIVSKLFYFILYLCAFEITPILILYKLIV